MPILGKNFYGVPLSLEVRGFRRSSLVGSDCGGKSEAKTERMRANRIDLLFSGQIINQSFAEFLKVVIKPVKLYVLMNSNKTFFSGSN